MPTDQETRLTVPVAAWLQFGRDRVGLPPAPLSGEPLALGVTIVVCTYKRAASLTRWLDSLLTQQWALARLIIVDASPDDETERAVRDHAALATMVSDALYFRVAGPLRGLTRQRNLALGWVHTDLVAFFDDDVVLGPDCCLELERQHRLRGPALVGVAAVIEDDQPPRLLWRLRAWLRIVSTLRPGTYSRSGFPIPWSLLTPTDEALVQGDWLPGGATMWRTAPAREVGFNEAFAGYCSGEDLDFSLRMRAKGGLAVAPRARVSHLHDESGRPNALDLGYMNARNSYDIHRRCLLRRTKMDDAYFVYAWSVDTMLQALAVAKVVNGLRRCRFVQGRLRFLLELALRRER